MGKTSHNQSPKLYFPKIKRIKLDAFSLYTRHPDIELKITNGVTCLAGANGIGKSTFLAAINYGLTGAVPTAERKLKDIHDYYRNASRYSSSFFEGRIREQDRETASVSLEIIIADKLLTISRPLFSPQELTELTVRDKNTKKVIFDGKDMPDSTKESRYREFISKYVGVETFEQYVFLQHFVFTFDESRHLLFWDNRAIEQVLYLAFGTNAAAAAAAEKIKREMEKADSRIRNLKFQESNVSKRIKIIQDAVTEDGDADNIEELLAKYNALTDAREKELATVDKYERELSDIRVKISEETGKVISLRTAYSEAFSAHLKEQGSLAKHPIIQSTFQSGICGICGTKHKSFLPLKKQIETNHCPLCETDIPAKQKLKSGIFVDLQKLDKELAKAKATLETEQKKYDRLETELSKSRQDVAYYDQELKQFESDNTEWIDRIKGKQSLGKGAVGKRLKELQSEKNELFTQRQKELKLREEKKTELSNAIKKLEERYFHAEKDFVPLFNELAVLFLGMELDVLMQTQSDLGIALVLKLRGETRFESFQLSESQRFFIDIALRMALARYISAKDSPASLFIDTPEGSLDIAYEKRAGELFAKFVKSASGHDMFMTANINTSRLLLELAAACGASRMTLVEMTKWADLSDVQLQEEGLFKTAIAHIKRELQT